MAEVLDFGGKKLGFGCMRLPMVEGTVGQEGEVDLEKTCAMVDRFMAEGFRYFDTAHGYIGEKSEPALRKALVDRYPRESYILTDKLSGSYIKKREDVRPYLEMQLEITGAKYFDYYLCHALTVNEYKKFTDLNIFPLLKEFKEEGLIRHIGISFHDKATVLEQILTEHPEIEVVQIQFNYNDYLDASVQSKAVYEVCRKFDKPVLIMEPIKGGSLVNLPEEGAKLLSSLGGGSNASYALRFAASFEGVAVVLSGMSEPEQMEDNLSFMKDFKPLDEKEMDAVMQVAKILAGEDQIPCTACRYCVAGCPKHILIPDLFACRNTKKRWPGEWNSNFYYGVSTSDGHGKASDCIGCRKCARVCPQHLDIPELLKEVAEIYEKPAEQQ